MASLTSKLILQLVDQVTAPARKIQQSLRTLTGVGSGLSFGQAMTRDVRALTSATRDFGRAASVPASMLAALGGRAVYNLQKTGNTIQAVTGMTDEQRASMEEYMRALNKDFPFTNAQIAQTALELARAGLSIEQMRGSLRDTLTLSLAGDIENAHASDLATNIMTAMRMPMETAEQSAASMKRIVDTLTYSANRSNTTVAMMGETFKYAAPLAAAVGMEVEELAGLSMVLANNGIKASEAGVAMRSALVRMVRPTKPMLASLERLNININDFVTSGRLVNSNDIIGSLSSEGIDAEPVRKAIDDILSDTALQQSPARLVQSLTTAISEALGSDSIVDRSALADTLTDAVTAASSHVDFMGFLQRLRDLKVPEGEMMRIFDQRQGSRLLSLMTRDLHAQVEDIHQNAADSGDRVAKTMTKGIVGGVYRLVASLENIANVMANTGVLDEVTAAIHRISDALEALSKSNPAFLKFISYGILATAALLPLGFAATAAGAALRMIFFSVRLLTTLSLWPVIAGLKALGSALSLSAIASAMGFASSLGMIGAIIGTITAPVWGLVAAALALALAIWNYWVPISEFIGGFASVVGSAIGELVSVIAGAGGAIAAAVAAWALDGLVDIGALLGLDEATVRAAMDVALSGITSTLDAIIGVVRAVPAAVAGWIGDIFAMNQYSEAAVAGFRSAGERAGQALVNAIKAAVNGLVSWFSSLPSRIAAAIGSIDLGKLVKWPSWPSWLGGGSSTAVDGARAAGGPVRAGGSYLVGEEGPELVTFGQHGFVHDAMKTARIMRNAALAATASAAPAFALPSVPSFDHDRTGDRHAAAGGRVDINVGGISFQITAAPGQSPQQIAEAVERHLSAKLRQLSNSAFSDGVY